MNRRKFLHQAGLGAGALLVAPGWLLPKSGGRYGSTGTDRFDPDLEIALKATPAETPILPGQPTRVWQFQGEVLQGDAKSLQTLENSYLGPVLRVRKGQKIRIRFTNDIPEASIVHWHGLHVPAVMDGHPRFVIPRGRTYVYEFEVVNRAGTYWYHPHPHGRTGPQVYYGMAGFLLVSDEEEARLPLPKGEYDLPLVLQDRTFDANNQLVYLGGGRMMGGMMARMQGFLGDQILVNGRPDFSLSVATRAYRLRLLNGSNSRIYKLAWNDGTPMTVIGTDGGLLEKPIQKEYVVMGPGQRLDLWVDFSKKPVGTRIALRSLEFSGAMAGNMMMGGMMGRGMMGRGRSGMAGGSLANGADFTVMTVRVERREKETLRLPAKLTPIPRHNLEDAVNKNQPRRFSMLMRHMTWTINGRTFEMTNVANEEIVRLDTLEVWELVNAGGGMGRGMMGMALPHPIHLHGEQFQVLERAFDPALTEDWLTLKDGVIDEGWQDVTMLFPGQKVKILRRFSDYEGLFLYHCHNLEHEDMGMMRNFLVKG